jgi:uncharacterized protein
MGCTYCGQEHYKSHSSAPRVERLVSRVEATMRRPETEHVTVTWFGGEPLLAYRLIQEMSERFLACAQATSTSYTARMATNGSLISLRKLQQLYDACRLREMVITLDGPREIHDRRRFLKSGRPSFDHCVRVLSAVTGENLVPDLNISLRVNVDKENQEHVPALLHDLADAGLASQRFEIDLMPVHSWGNDVSQVELEAAAYARRETQWIRLALDLGFRVALLPTASKNSTCVATTRSGEIHDPEGSVYSCSEHPLVPGVRDTGIVADLEGLTGSGRRPTGAFDDWYDQVEDDGAQPCHRCPLLPVCGGSCPKLWREGHMPCPSIKFSMQDRLDLIGTTRLNLTAMESDVHAGS